jgi:hypothetical protein
LNLGHVSVDEEVGGAGVRNEGEAGDGGGKVSRRRQYNGGVEREFADCEEDARGDMVHLVMFRAGAFKVVLG